MEKELEKIYTEARRKSDEELLANGAVVFSNGNQIILDPTLEQKERERENYEQEKKLLESEIEKRRNATINKYITSTKRPVIKEHYSREQFKEIIKQRLLYAFKKNGFILEVNGLDIYDLERIKADKQAWKNIFNTGYVEKTKQANILKKPTKELVITILGEDKIISLEEYKKYKLNELSEAEMPKKPLFNIPREVKDVTDVETIKKKEYYLNYWDIFKNLNINREKEFLLEDGDKISLIELYMAVKIFRDLDGYRDETGQLMIFDSQIQKFVEARMNILIKLKVFRTLYLGMHKTLTQYCPHLLESGLLKLSDFEEKKKGEESNQSILRTEKTASSPKKFQVGFNGVVYYLGGKHFNFDGEKILIKDIKAVDLDSDYIGIVRVAGRREELVYKILKVKDSEKEDLLTRGAYKIKVGNVTELKANLTKERIEKYQVTDVIPERSGESEEEYAERLKKLPDYKEINAVTNELSIKTGIGIHNLPWREQIQIAQMSFESSFDENKKKRFIDFVKNYGLTGLRAFLSLEQGGLEMGEKILLIGERLGGVENEKGEDEKNRNRGEEGGDDSKKSGDEKSENDGGSEKNKTEKRVGADLIFERYAELVDLTENVREELKGQIKKSDIEVGDIDDAVIGKIAESVLLKANGLLINFANKLERGEVLSGADIERELEDYNDDLLFTFSLLKSLRGQLKLEDLEGVSFKKVSVERYRKLNAEVKLIYEEKYTREDVEKIDDLSKRERVGEVYDMFELYRKNYEDRQEFLKVLLDGFRDILLGNNKMETNLYLMKQNGRVVAFNRYDKISGSQKRLGSCNVLHSVQAMAIGGEVFKESLKREIDGDYEVSLAADAFSPEAGMYIEKGQFRVEQITDEFDPEGVLSFVMRRIKNSERKSYYEGKDMIQEFRKQADNVGRGEVADRFVLEFDSEVGGQKNYVKKLVNERGFVVTRYVFNKKDGKVYLGLERK